MVIEKVGKLPVNSRISIDYTKNPVQIDFAYPDPDAGNIRRSDAVYIPAILIGTLLFLFLYMVFLYWVQPIMYPHILSTDTLVNNITINQYEYPNGTKYGFNSLFIEYNWNDKPRYTTVSLDKIGYIWIMPYFSDNHNNNTRMDLLIVAQAFILIAVWLLIVWLNSFWVSKIFTSTKWGNRKFPEINKKLHDSKYSAEFFPQDFPQTGNTLEIPLFKNMYMDYEATGEFSEYLEKIEIIEHPFKHHIKKGLPFSKKRKHVIKKPNIYLWKTVFTFKEGCKPQTGSLIMRWT